MTKRILASLLLSASLLGAGCGGGAELRESSPVTSPGGTEASPEPSETAASPGAASTAANVGAARFVFGASPGKPVVYWIHTDW